MRRVASLRHIYSPKFTLFEPKNASFRQKSVTLSKKALLWQKNITSPRSVSLPKKPLFVKKASICQKKRQSAKKLTLEISEFNPFFVEVALFWLSEALSCRTVVFTKSRVEVTLSGEVRLTLLSNGIQKPKSKPPLL